MTDIICLSSSDEDDEPPKSEPKKKRVKLTRVKDNHRYSKVSESIILSDDDEDLPKTNEKEKLREVSNGLTVQDKSSKETNVVPEDLINNEETKVDDEKDNEAAQVDENALLQEENEVDNEEDKENNAIEEPVENETELDVKFREFCAKCSDYIEKFDEKQMLNERLDSLIKTYAKLKKYDALNDFDTFLLDQTKQIDCSSTPMVSFHSVFKWALDKYLKVKKENEKKAKIISKLTNTMDELVKKIKKFQEAEVDLDDEEGSSYVKVEAYERRLVNVHTKLCKLEGTDPNEGRITYSSLRFQHSTNSLINKAINHKYKDSNFLPDFYEFNKFLKKLAAKGGIKMSEEKLKLEIRSCFEHLTKLIKKNRQRELYEVQRHYVDDMPDETLKDSKFNAKIREGHQKSNKKMDEVMKKFVDLQETGADPSLSSDSDNSNFDEQSE